MSDFAHLMIAECSFHGCFAKKEGVRRHSNAANNVENVGIALCGWDGQCPGGTLCKMNRPVECMHCVARARDSRLANRGTQTVRLIGPEGPLQVDKCNPLTL